jgi:hypothetical protein
LGPHKLVEEDIICKAYQSIIQVIKDRTDNKKGEESKTIDYYEAVRIAYTESCYMQKYLDKKEGNPP